MGLLNPTFSIGALVDKHPEHRGSSKPFGDDPFCSGILLCSELSVVATAALILSMQLTD